MKRIGWKIIPVLLFAGLCFFLWRGLSLDPHRLPSTQIGKQVPQFNLNQLDHPQMYFNSQQMPNKVFLLNVWASWCEACVQEQAFLMQLAQEGVVIYGLNYKDNTQEANEWLRQWGNPFQMIGQDTDGKVAIDLGVYGAPETFVIDKQGIIRYRHVGIITQKDWDQVIAPMMKQLERSA